MPQLWRWWFEFSVGIRRSLSTVNCCEKVNPPVRSYEEMSQYLIRGFASMAGVGSSSVDALFLTLLLCYGQL